MNMARYASVLAGLRARSAQSSGRGGRYRWRVLVTALAISGVTAPACGGSRGRVGAGDNTRITAQELSRLTASNVYDAVAQLRPLWLQSRGRRSNRLPTEIVVAQNGSYFGPLSSLRQFRIGEVKELRYLDGPQAGAFLSGLGSRHVEGAIIVQLH
jgi:hypothetical protein